MPKNCFYKILKIKIKIVCVYFFLQQEDPDNKINAAAIVIAICDHISAGFHQTKIIIANARSPLHLQHPCVEHAGASSIAVVFATFFTTFFATFFFAIIFTPFI